MTIVQCEYMESKLGTTHSTCNILRSRIDCVKNMNTDVGVCADLLGNSATSTNMLEQAESKEPSFDWNSSALGTGIGFVAGYALMKAFRRNKPHSEDRLIEPLL